MLPQYRPVQIAYFVNDIRESAHNIAATTGAGPFYVIENIELERCNHRGVPCDFIHSSAYGQWGDLMLELVQQEDDGPSPFRDMYKSGSEGIHHVACFVESLELSQRQYQEMGYPVATHAKAKLGTEFSFIDTRKLLGHMIEIYVPDENLTGFYSMVKDASTDWQGEEALRSL